MECENENLHASIYSDIIFRKPEDFSVCDIEQEGIVQLVSLLPHSYPGHSILTEDIGKLVGVDTCPCGRKGKYFKIFGRIKKRINYRKDDCENSKLIKCCVEICL